MYASWIKGEAKSWVSNCHIDNLGCLGYPAPGFRPSYPALGPHKNFNQLNLFLVKVQWLWSCAHYFQWFMGYLNHVDLLMLCLTYETALFFTMHLGCFADFILCPTNKYMFKIDNKKIRLICWMCSKLKINTAWHSFCCWLWPQSAYK